MIVDSIRQVASARDLSAECFWAFQEAFAAVLSASAMRKPVLLFIALLASAGFMRGAIKTPENAPIEITSTGETTYENGLATARDNVAIHVGEELAGLVGCGEGADQVEIDAAQEQFVIGNRRRLDADFFELIADEPIELARLERRGRRLEPVLGFEGGHRRRDRFLLRRVGVQRGSGAHQRRQAQHASDS